MDGKAVAEIAAIVKDEWQSSWNRSACFTKFIVPSVDSKINFSGSRCIGMSMIRCALNHAGVSDILFRMNLADSPNCKSCGLCRETVSHVLLECERLRGPRLKLQSSSPLHLSDVADFVNPSLVGMSKSRKKAFWESLHEFWKHVVV